MKTIWKFEVPVDDRVLVLDLPRYGRIVHVAAPYGTVDRVFFWVEFELEMAEFTDSRAFLVVGTGHGFSPEWEQIGTVVTSSLGLVWHLLERKSL